MPVRERFPTYVLVGGRSRRMGTDKTRLTLAGETFVERLCRASGDRVVTLVGKVASGGSRRTIVDTRADWAAIHGLETALADASDRGWPWALVLSVDVPLLQPATIDRLEEAAARSRAAEVVLPESDGFLQPLVACYRPRLLETVRRQIEADRRGLIALVRSVEHQVVERAELGAAAEELWNLNTTDDLARAASWLEGRMEER